MRLSEINVTARETQRGWLGPLPRDPAADPPNLANVRLQPLPVRDASREGE